MLCNPVDYNTPGSSALHHLPEFAQIHVHWVGDAIQPSHPLPPPSPFAVHLSQHQGHFQWVGSWHQVAKAHVCNYLINCKFKVFLKIKYDFVLMYLLNYWVLKIKLSYIWKEARKKNQLSQWEALCQFCKANPSLAFFYVTHTTLSLLLNYIVYDTVPSISQCTDLSCFVLWYQNWKF